MKKLFHENGLSIVMFSLFIVFLSVGQYMRSPTFWFESFQNWQSEFLSIGLMVVLSIFLRQKGSPESKPIDHPHSETGA